MPHQLSKSVRSFLDDLHEKVADKIVREVAELPDRTSPADCPEMMMVTAEELKGIIKSALAESDR